MKKIIISLFVSILFFSSCYQAMSSSPAAVSAGVSIAGVIGSIIGDHADGWHGSQFGALIGTIAGAAISNVITTPKSENSECYDKDICSDSQGHVKNVSNVDICNIRFIDDNRNHRG
ncbi:hypothetical protein [Phocaeicola abscessus]|uniref:hypothetical protein n=2 Tax=Phocaeicola abscessus TaxID=555313 RepID=UPI0004B303FC|nr:hypothetical protein [Phocaeicola abscessus]